VKEINGFMSFVEVFVDVRFNANWLFGCAVVTVDHSINYNCTHGRPRGGWAY